MLQIVVLEGGSVVEQGSHEALLSLGGRYTQLWNQQTVSDSNVDVLETIEATNESARTWLWHSEVEILTLHQDSILDACSFGSSQEMQLVEMKHAMS